MTRISSAMVNTAALRDLQKAQSDLYDVQRKSSTQKEATDVKGYGDDTRSLVSMNRMRAKSESYIQTGDELKVRLSLQDQHLSRARSSFEDLKIKLTEASALNDFSGLAGELEKAFSNLKGAMNASQAGEYMFGGTRPDTAPVQADSLTDLAANPLDDAFTQDNRERRIKIDDTRQVSAGPLGQTLSRDAMELLRDLQIFEEGASGPFSDNPTAAEKAAVIDAIGRLEAINEDLIMVEGENGRILKTVEETITAQQSQYDLLTSLAGGITDVDLAEVAVNLNQAQTQYQATAAVFRTVQDLSLVNLL